MKKYIFILLSIITLGLTSCSEPNPELNPNFIPVGIQNKANIAVAKLDSASVVEVKLESETHIYHFVKGNTKTAILIEKERVPMTEGQVIFLIFIVILWLIIFIGACSR